MSKKRFIIPFDFTPLDCRFAYWENHVVSDDCAICLCDAIAKQDPAKAFAIFTESEQDWIDCGCPCADYEPRWKP